MNNCYVNVCGGVGNQLFQVAAGYAYSRKFDKELFIDSSKWGAHQGNSPETYKTTLFRNFSYGKVFTRDVIGFHEKGLNYTEIPFHINSVSLNGYFQSLKYFEKHKNEFIPLLALPEIDFYPPKDDVCFHIRRGDYLQFQKVHYVCDTDYFNNLFDRFNGKNIYVITDSPDHVLNEFDGKDFKLIKTNSDLEDLTVMSKFNNIVCSNSSFSWWASLIGGAENVYVPPRWYVDNRQCEDIYRPEMIKCYE